MVDSIGCVLIKQMFNDIDWDQVLNREELLLFTLLFPDRRTFSDLEKLLLATTCPAHFTVYLEVNEGIKSTLSG